MATLYVWSASVGDRSVGHVSLCVHGTNDYISWWPTDRKEKLSFTRKKVSTTESLPQTYEEDRDKFMERPANYTYDIEEYCIDTDRITQKWHSILKGEGYNLLTKNCATVVMDVLRSGILCKKFYPKQRLSDVFFPRDVQKYGKQLQALKYRTTAKESISNRIVPRFHNYIYSCNCDCIFEQGVPRYHICAILVLFCVPLCLFILCYLIYRLFEKRDFDEIHNV